MKTDDDVVHDDDDDDDDDDDVVHISYFYWRFCSRCMLCVSTFASVHYLISINTATTLISWAGKNNVYCFVCEALWTDGVVFRKGRFDAVLKATIASCTVGNFSNSKHMNLNRFVKHTT